MSRKPPRIHLATLGCRLNEAELQAWSRQFRACGCAPDAASEDADLIVVNTCAVTGEAMRKSRQLVRRAQQHNPTAHLVVTGCYAGLAPDSDSADLGIDLLIDNADKDELVTRVCREFDVPRMPAAAMAADAQPLPGGRHRAFVKVQDGCRYRCTYCIVTHTRGDERSRPIADVVAEIRALEDAGVREVVLTGVHLGGYGVDRDNDLAQLIVAVLAQTGIPRVRLGSLEPWDLPEGFWSLFNDPRLLPHLHLPMQSGADSVLRRMARRCRTDEFRRLAEIGRARVPQLNITTDLIVGFPGETDDEWRQTLAFADELAFGHIHVFAYSRREGTKAAGLPGQVPHAIKRERSRQLHEVALRHRRAWLDAQRGQAVDVLFESREQLDDGGIAWRGYAPNYVRVRCETGADVDLDNRIHKVHLTDTEDTEILGTLAAV